MLRVCLTLVAVYVLAVVQTAVCPLLHLETRTPDPLAFLAALMAWFGASPYRFMWCGLVGLVHDVVGVGRLGPAMVWFAVVGYLLLRTRRVLYRDHFLLQLLAAAAGTAAIELGLFAIRRLLGDSATAWHEIGPASVMVAVYSLAGGWPLVLIARRLSRAETALEAAGRLGSRAAD